MANLFGPSEFFYAEGNRLRRPIFPQKKPKKAIERDGHIYVLKDIKDDMEADLRLRDRHIEEVKTLAIKALAASTVALILSAATLIVSVLR